MNKRIYRYDGGYSIEILGYDSAIGGIRCAVMHKTRSRFDGTPYQCLEFVAARGSAKALRHLDLLKRQMMELTDGRSIHH